VSLTGDLATMELLDLLSWLAQRRKTGTLHVRSRAVHKQLVLRDGSLQACHSNDPRETLGQFLVRDRLITEEDLFKALLRQEQERRRLGAILVADGVLTADQVKRALRENGTEAVYDLFIWTEGRFDFQDREQPREQAIDLQLDLTSVVKEGERRLREWERMRERFPSVHVVFRVVGRPGAGGNAKELQLFDLAAEGRTLEQIAVHTRRSRFETALFLHDLCERGLLAVDHVADESAVTDAASAIVELLKIAAALLQEARFDAAFEAYENVLALDGLNQEAKKGLLAAAEARRKARLVRKVDPEKIPVLCVPTSVLSSQKFDSHEGFVLSRINGEWDVRSILKLCPMPEEDILLIFARLLDRKVITLR
jgi:Domain of unknown function (DUF4388)